MIQHLSQLRIVGFVVDDEPGVHCQPVCIFPDLNGVRVPADIIVGFKNNYIMVFGKQMSSNHP